MGFWGGSIGVWGLLDWDFGGPGWVLQCPNEIWRGLSGVWGEGGSGWNVGPPIGMLGGPIGIWGVPMRSEGSLWDLGGPTGI